MISAAAPDTPNPQREDADLGQAALTYATRYGWRVFPILPGGKTPMTARGFHDATTDPAQVRAWWQQWPDANIGLATGAESNLFVIDADTYHADFPDDPDTRAWRTSRLMAASAHGGSHAYFTYPPNRAWLTVGTGKPFPHWDYRGEGGYIIAPPSRLSDCATPYHWTTPLPPPPADGPLALDWPCPGYLMTLKQREQRPRAAPAREETGAGDAASPVTDAERDQAAAYWLERFKEQAAEGNRNQTGFELACQLRDSGLDEAVAEATMLAYADHANTVGDTPYTEQEALQSLRQAYSRAPREAADLSGDGAPAALPQMDPAPDPPRAVAPRSLSALLRTDLPAVQWAVPDLIPQGLSILAGRPKVGKSWLGLALAVAVGTPGNRGRAFGRLACTSGNVLYLALEDTPRRLRERTLRILGADAPQWQGTVDFETTWERLDRGGYERLDAYLTAHPDTRLVLIDTFAKIRPAIRSRAGISYDEDYQAMSLLKRLADQHATALVVIHHTRKGAADDPQDLVSGTTGLTGAADSTLVLFRPRRGQEGEMKLFLTGRDIEEQELGLAWSEQTCTYSVIGESAAALDLSAKRRQVVDFFRARAWEPCRQVDVLRGLGWNDTSGGVGSQLLHRMLDAGALRRVGGQVAVASYLRDTALPPLQEVSTLSTASTVSILSTMSTCGPISDERPTDDGIDGIDNVDSVDTRGSAQAA